MAGKKSKGRSRRNLRPRDPGKQVNVNCDDENSLEQVKDFALVSEELNNKVTLTRNLADMITENLQKASCIQSELNYGKCKGYMPLRLKCLETRIILAYDMVGSLLINVRICLGEEENIIERLKTDVVFATEHEQFF